MTRSEPLSPIAGDNIVRDEILYLPLTAIDPDPEQPRLDVDDELAGSIQQHGVLQAIQVRPHPVDAERWMIVDGERRYRGALRAKLATIPATITLEVEDPGDRIIQQIVRNEGKPLTPGEEALAFKKIIDARHAAGDKKYGVVQLARDLGIAKSTISDRLTLTEIPSLWLELIVKGPLQTSHAPILHRWRKVPEKFQKIALEQMKKDFRWPGESPNAYKKAKGGDRLYVGDFETLVRAFFPKFVKPVGDCPGYKGPTEALTIDTYTGRKVYAMDPSQWGPIWRKGLAARKAKQAKKNKSSGASSESTWQEENRRAREKQEREAAAWKAALPGVVDRLVTAVASGAIDDALGQLLIDDDRGFRGKEEKAILARVAPGESATELIRYLAYREIIDEITASWNGPQAWKKLEKRLGLAAQQELAAGKKKRGKKARQADAPAPAADDEYVTVPDYEIVDADTSLEEVATL